MPRPKPPIPVSDLEQLSESQRQGLLAFVRNTMPKQVSHAVKEALLARKMIKPSGPRHRSYYLTAPGRNFALALLCSTRTTE